MRPTRTMVAAFFTIVWLASAPAAAHHEAIFGPQAALVMSRETYLTGQIFTKRTGTDQDGAQQTTAVLSGGVAPFKRPISFSVVLPVSFVRPRGLGTSRMALEDVLVGMRYRFSTPALSRTLSLDESYVLGAGGLELPTGTMDHEFGRGALGITGAVLIGVEARPFSAIAYGYGHRHGEYESFRESTSVFAGAGGAWTPVDNEPAGRLLSLQLGISREETFAEERGGTPLVESGGGGLYLHPSVVWSTSPRVQFFTLVSVPLAQDWRADSNKERFRLGAGAVIVLDH